MAVLRLPAPAKAVQVDQLRDELADALDIPAPYVDVYPDRLEVVGEVDESMRDTIVQTVDAHVPQAPPPSAEERLAALEAEVRGIRDRSAIEAAKSVTTPQDVAAAVRGSDG